jgi:acetylornithine/succinyldiaminopimelate/putrescine aminotransferase
VEKFVEWLNEPVDPQTGLPIDIPYRSVILASTQDKHGKGKGMVSVSSSRKPSPFRRTTRRTRFASHNDSTSLEA